MMVSVVFWTEVVVLILLISWDKVRGGMLKLLLSPCLARRDQY